MEFKLQVGWFNYFLSGLMFAAFLAALILLCVAPDTATVSQILVVALAPIASIFAFLKGCQVKPAKKKQPPT